MGKSGQQKPVEIGWEMRLIVSKWPPKILPLTMLPLTKRFRCIICIYMYTIRFDVGSCQF